MADESLPSGYIEIGAAYLAALQKLGLNPDGLFWARDKTVNEFVLILVTRHFDYAGPLEIFRLLTRAYNLSATPCEVSPFIIRLHSPKQEVIRNMLVIDAHDARGKRSTSISARGEIADIQYINHWVYKWPPTKQTEKRAKKEDATSRAKAFRRFKENVEKLAA